MIGKISLFASILAAIDVQVAQAHELVDELAAAK
jgi:hypothetical protein